MTLHVNPDIVHHLAELARTYHAREAVMFPADAQRPGDDWRDEILTAQGDDPTLDEFRAVIADLEPDQLAELTALFLVGREDEVPTAWPEAVAAAQADTPRPLDTYLIGHPLLAEYLEAGLDAVAALDEP